MVHLSADRNAENYFKNRRISCQEYNDYKINPSIISILPSNKASRVLEIGCGFGQMLKRLSEYGYSNLHGIDISKEAVDYCKSIGLDVEEYDLLEYASGSTVKYDLVVMSHVLEHIDKTKIISLLTAIKTKLLSSQGKLVIIVPNAQSDLGCYWAYEDFTHTVLFTAGSLYYVLSAAGFSRITFVDPDCLDGLSPIKKIVKTILLNIYKFNRRLWNRITTNAYHKTSEQIFSYEIKVLAS